MFLLHVSSDIASRMCVFLIDIPRDPIWGIFQIASAIEFLHTDVKAIHGLICPFAIFVTVEEGNVAGVRNS